MLYSLQITTKSAQETLAICLRQAIKDSRKVITGLRFIYGILASEAAMKRYRIIRAIAIQLFTIVRLLAAFLFTLLREKLERYEASCRAEQLSLPEVQEEPQISQVEKIESETQVAIAPVVEESITPTDIPDDREGLKRLARELAIAGYTKMSTTRLRKAVRGALAA